MLHNSNSSTSLKALNRVDSKFEAKRTQYGFIVLTTFHFASHKLLFRFLNANKEWKEEKKEKKIEVHRVM